MQIKLERGGSKTNVYKLLCIIINKHKFAVIHKSDTKLLFFTYTLSTVC